ncbi:MAG: hypothetical protein ACQGVK_07990 [Myxococcota bacterium]
MESVRIRALAAFWGCLLGGCLLGGCLLAAAAVQAEPFTFVSLPDTQVYADDRVPDGRYPAVTDTRGTGAIFFDQTEWIVDNAEALGIRYVGHLGDIVEHGDDLSEWALADDAMHLLRDADIPHGTVMGNHDDNHGPNYRQNYLDHFGPQHFEDRPWYTASSPGGGANLQVLEHEHRKIGFLNFSIDHPQAEIDWATGIVEANPDTIFIIGTHRYLYDFKIAGGRYSEDVETPLGTINLGGGPVGGVVEPNTAQDLFDEFVTQHPNILMIHAGHFHGEWLRLDGQNSTAQTVLQILTDYQSTRNGGDGWLRIYELDFENDRFSFDTYSPTLDRTRSTIDHFVEMIFLSYDQRDQIMDVLGVDEATYFALLQLTFKNNPTIPDGFLKQHPDLDEPHEQAYFERYLDELFLGDPPEGFGDLYEWEQLWMIGFAADPTDPFDFDESVRSPSYTLDVDYSAYFTPSAEQRVAFAFEGLLEALASLDSGDFLFRSAGALLTHRVERAFKKARKGKTDRAARLLEHGVLAHTDGCAERGRPDGFWSFLWWWFRGWLFLDWIDDCDAQDVVHPALLDTLDQLEAAEAPL